MAISKEKTVFHEQDVEKRSFFGLIKYLAITSRLNNIAMLLTSFGGVISTLLAGISKLQDDPTSTSPLFILRQAALCIVHCALLGAAGNTWNDLMDRDIDSKVARTKDRPLASGKVSTAEAFAWMACLYSISVSALNVMLGGRNIWPMAIPLTAIVMLYPLMKRSFPRKLRIYPQYLLGFALGYPSMYGWASVYGKEIPISVILGRCLPLWIFLFFWSFYSNTAYSYQDVEDDRKVGVNSAYNMAGKRIWTMLAILASLTILMIPFILLPFSSGWLWISWLGAWVPGIIEQLSSFDPKRPETGGDLHFSTVKLGFWTVFACTVELYLPKTITG